MSLVQTYMAAVAQGIDLISEAPQLGDADGPVARELVELHGVYFGEERFSRKQAAAVAAARRTGKSLAAMRIIEHRLKGVKDKQQRWNLRVELCGLAVDEDELDAIARQRTATPPKNPKAGVRIKRRKGRNWSLTLTGCSEDIADLAEAFGLTVESAKKCVFGKGAVAAASKMTNVIIPLDALTKVMAGEGSDVTLRMTNGAEISGARLVESTLAAHGLITLLHPVDGPVNLYRTQRFASAKQRQMALAENPVCAWPGCNKPGEECQIHHIHAWSHGGETNASNLTTLCAYHNGINEDDPNAPPRRGRVTRNRSKVVWRPPWSEE